MLQPKIFSTSSGAIHVLCLGAHCDDVEIGCGASLLHLLDAHPSVKVTWVVFTSNAQRKRETLKSADLFLRQAQSRDIHIYDMRDGYLPYTGHEIKDTFEKIKANIDTPDIIFTHYRNDLHQDHRIVSELTWNTFRNHLIFEYEIPKWDGDLGAPNSFVGISKSYAKQKIEILQQVYNTQAEKKWFTDDLFWSLMRLRGMECGADTGLAEAFYSRKVMFDFLVDG